MGGNGWEVKEMLKSRRMQPIRTRGKSPVNNSGVASNS